MGEKTKLRDVPAPWLFLLGVALEAATVAAVFTDRNLGAVLILSSAGIVAVLGAVFIRAAEGHVRAGKAGVSLEWRREFTEQVAQVARTVSADEREESGSDESRDIVARLSLAPASSVELADVNNDGEVELVVQHPVGAHSMQLRVFGWSKGDSYELPAFGEISTTVSGLGSPFAVGDLDNDGRVEIATIEADWAKPGASSAGGPYVELLYRWDGVKFAEAGRNELGPASDFRSVRFAWYKLPERRSNPDEPS